MDYRSDFRITTSPELLVGVKQEIVEKLEEITCGYEFDIYGNEIVGSYCYEWDKHISDMLELSMSYPNILFKLHVIGGENGDQTKCAFINAELYTVFGEMVFPDFDEKFQDRT